VNLVVLTRAVTAFLVLGLGAAAPQAPKEFPPSQREDFREVLHGVELIDPYHWLEDLSSPRTRAWIEAQNAYTRALLLRPLARTPIRTRLLELLKIDTMSPPRERGGRYFFSKKPADQDRSILYMRRGLNGNDEVLLDPDKLFPDRSTAVQTRGISQDVKLLAYAVRLSGRDEVEIRILDVDSRKDLRDRLPPGLYSGVSFTPGRRGFYYSRRDRRTGGRIYYHALGSAPARDREVFGTGAGPNQFLGAGVSEDGRYLLITVQHGWASNEIHIQDLKKGGPVRPIVKDIDALFQAEWAGPRSLVVQTGWKAPKRRLLRVDVENPAPDLWREIVPESADAIESFAVIGGKLFVTYLHNLHTQVKVFSLEGQPLGQVPLPDLASGDGFGRWNSDQGILSFSSFTLPFSSFRYNAKTGAREPWFESRVKMDPSRFETRQVWYTSKDGTRVPMFLVHQKGLKLDANRPTLLTGYGGFNASMTPSFSALAVLWAEHDGVFALPNLRGGGEFGEEWHRAGMLENKQNVFDDFIAAAEWLIEHQYTNPSRLAIQGGSNGGLLVGAALTQRPDLFRAVLCGYPDLDMVRYYRYTENNNPPAPLEYGDASDPRQFKFLYAYSPCERVKPGTPYPAVLLTTGEGDTRVPPQQALKMTAKLRWATRSGRPVLLRYDTKSGHAGGRPFSRMVEDESAEQAFLFWQLGVH